MRTFCAIALLFPILFHTPALAAECHDLAGARKDNDAYTFAEISGDDMARFVANYNATEPVSDHHPDEVWIAFMEGEANVHVILIAGGCISSQDAIPVNAFLKMATSAPGDPA